jgi:hypothetical protein
MPPTFIGAAPISVGGDTLHPNANACFTCTPPYQHAREWQPDPNTPDRGRTLVLCFDGTGDSFDQDVSTPGLQNLSDLGHLS